jgi:hypothetical protein
MWARALPLVALVLITQARLTLPGDCHLCHQAAVMSDMTFPMNLLKRFVASGAEQYRLCPHPGRQACPFR